MPNSLYIARDSDGALWLFDREPRLIFVDWCNPDAEFSELERHFYPDLKPGECRRLVMEQQDDTP